MTLTGGSNAVRGLFQGGYTVNLFHLSQYQHSDLSSDFGDQQPQDIQQA